MVLVASLEVWRSANGVSYVNEVTLVRGAFSTEMGDRSWVYHFCRAMHA